ncbi:glycosyltransferase family 4 protein [Geodermatophilus sp. SYSU D01186]
MLVTNAGTHPELQHVARELAVRGSLSGYRTSLGWSDSSPVMTSAWARPMRKVVGRRTLRGIPVDKIERRGTLLEIGHLLAIQKPYWSVARRLIRERTEWFDRLVARELRRGEVPDLVIAQATGARAILAAAARRGIPTVLNCPIAHHRWMERHLAAEAERNPEWAATLQHHDLDEDWADRLDEEISLASVLVVASNFAAETYVAAGVDRARMLTVPLGVSLPAEVGDALRDPHHGLRVLFVGMLTQRKGLSYLVDAFEAADLPEGSRLVLAGRPIGDAAAICARHPRIDLLGQLTKSDLDDVYRKADVFALPSLVEGFGLVGLEAMARGLPTVVSTHTFGADIIRDGIDGYVVPAGEVEPLAAALTELGSSPDLRARMGKAAAARARAFSWDAYGSRMVGVLQDAGLL